MINSDKDHYLTTRVPDHMHMTIKKYCVVEKLTMKQFCFNAFLSALPKEYRIEIENLKKRK